MTDQEKLTDLIREAHKQCKAQKDCHVCEVYGNGSDCVYMLIANHLIANGVEIYNAEDEEALKTAQQRVMEAHGDLRYLQGVKFGVEAATKKQAKNPETNGDDIRAMNDEDLATMLVFERDDWCDYQCPDGSFFDTYEEAIAYTVEWLKKPVSEDCA